MKLPGLLLLTTLFCMGISLLWRNKSNPQKHLYPVLAAFGLLIWGMSLNNYNLAQQVASMVARFPQSQMLITVPFYGVWFVNLLFILVFWLCKGLLLVLHDKILQRLPEFLRNRYPGYFQHHGQFYLQGWLKGMGRLLFWYALLFCVFFLLVMLEGMRSVFFNGSFLLWSPFLLFVVELSFYLRGEMRQLDESDRITVSDPAAQIRRLYNVIFFKYKKYFSPFILANRIYKKSFEPQTPVSVVAKLTERDVLISDIYNDHLNAVFDDLFRQYMRKGTQILVTAATRVQLEEIRQALQQSLQRQACITLVVDKESIEKRLWAQKNYDLVFMLTGQLESLWRNNELENLLPQLQLVIVPYSPSLPSSEYVLLREIFKKKLEYGPVRLLVLSEKFADIEKCVGRQFDCDQLVELQACSLTGFHRYLIIWEANPVQTYNAAFISGVDYIPPPSALSIVPLSTHVREMYWARVGDFEKDSFETLRAQLNSNAKIEEFRDVDMDAGRIWLFSNLMLFHGVDHRFLTIYDEVNNLPFTLTQLDRHGQITDEFINILAAPYLLRQYFLHHLDFFLSSPYYEKLMPVLTWPQYSIKSKLFSLFNALVQEPNGISAERIKDEYFPDQENVAAVTRTTLPLQITRQFLLDMYELFPETREMATNMVEFFSWDSQAERMTRHLDLRGGRSVQLDRPYEFVVEETNHQLIADQNLIDDNLIYKFKKGDQLSGRVIQGDQNDVAFYDIRRFDVNEKKVIVRRGDKPGKPRQHTCSVTMQIHEARSHLLGRDERKSSGYSRSRWSLSFTRRLEKLIIYPGTQGIAYPLARVHEKPGEYLPAGLLVRSYEFAPALEYALNLDGMNLQVEQTGAVAYTLSVVIRECLKSFFPYVYKQLHVYSSKGASVLPLGEDKLERVLRLNYPIFTNLPEPELAAEQRISIWIVEESQIGLGVVDFLDQYDENSQKLWEIVHDYLSYKCSEESAGDDYLFFGMEEPDRGRMPYDFQNALIVAARMVNNTKDCLNGDRVSWRAGNNVHLEANRYDPALMACDFCATRLDDKQHEILADGRIRCQACSDAAVTDITELRKIKEQVRRDIEKIFQVRIPQVEETEFRNADELHAELGQSFHPTQEFDSRAVGLALAQPTEKGIRYRILIEIGAPRWNIYLTIAHELTHIWQYINLELPDDLAFPLLILEGHSTFVEYTLAKRWFENGVKELEMTLKNLQERAETKADVYGEGLAHFLTEVEGKANPFQYMRNRQKR